MSVLAPLYLLGALAVAAPLLFHLIRRRVKQRTPVSFTLFLPVTQPRLRRNSRIENWLLLLLRAAALLLLAAAFSRPFLRQAATIETSASQRQWVVLVDTSASMRREDLWDQAMRQLRQTVAEIGPTDTLAIVTFDDSPRLYLGFDAFTQLGTQAHSSLDGGLAGELSPSWRHTDLGSALLFAADYASGQASSHLPVLVTDDASEPADEAAAASSSVGSSPAVQTQLVVISDLQSGADLSSLQAAGWPDDVSVQLRRVTAKGRSNAWLTLPQAAVAEDDDGRFRLRLSSTERSEPARVNVRWRTAADWTASGTAAPVTAASGSTASGTSADQQTVWPAVDLPPGQSRVMAIPSPPPQVLAVDLEGDQQSFDNRRYYVRPVAAEMSLAVVGPLADLPQDRLGYYLQRLPLDNAFRTVTVVADTAPPATLHPTRTPLVVVSGQVAPEAAAQYRQYLNEGGRLLYVLLPIDDSIAADDLLTALRWISGDPAAGNQADTNGQVPAGGWQVQEASGGDYAILSRIDFTHSLFAAFADPQFNDFSKIRFWAHRRLQTPETGWRTLAAFDDGSPALLEQTDTDHPGRLWVMTAGWQPADSQLALSTKFLPLFFELFETPTVQSTGPTIITLQPGQPLGQQLGSGDQTLQVQTIADADGAHEKSEKSEESKESELAEPASVSGGPIHEIPDGQTLDTPGVYRVRWGDQQRTVVVNLAESESQTDPLDDEVLERMGIKLGQPVPSEATEAAERQLRDAELEGQQRVWQWLLIGVLGLLALETAVGTKQNRTEQ